MRRWAWAALGFLLLGCSSGNGNGNGDAGGPDTTGAGTVACGTGLTCPAGVYDQTCCISGAGNAQCATPTNAACSEQGATELSCDDPSDCAADQVCCLQQLPGAAAAACNKPTNCLGAGVQIICTSSADCDVDGGGTTCKASFTAGGVTISTCQ